MFSSRLLGHVYRWFIENKDSLRHVAGEETLGERLASPHRRGVPTTNGSTILQVAPVSIKPSFPDNRAATHRANLSRAIFSGSSLAVCLRIHGSSPWLVKVTQSAIFLRERTTCLLVASRSSRRTSTRVKPNPNETIGKTIEPTTKMTASDISSPSRCKAEVHPYRDNRRHPESNEHSSFLACAHADSKPKCNRKQKREECRQENQPVRFREHDALPQICLK